MKFPPLSNENLFTREVWEQNLDDELAIIRGIVHDYPYVAMDADFQEWCAVPQTLSSAF